MKTYRVVMTPAARDDLRRHIAYLRFVLKNQQAAKSVWDDYVASRKRLAITAESLDEPESEKLRLRGLKRKNLEKHNYFMLFRIEGDTVVITNIFHSREDFENKLR